METALAVLELAILRIGIPLAVLLIPALIVERRRRSKA